MMFDGLGQGIWIRRAFKGRTRYRDSLFVAIGDWLELVDKSLYGCHCLVSCLCARRSTAEFTDCFYTVQTEDRFIDR
jgi:hypothetical protein